MGILLVLLGALITSVSVFLAGRFMNKRVRGAPRPGPLVPKWVIATGLIGGLVFLVGLVITLGNLL